MLPRSAQISKKSRKYKICRGYLPVLSAVSQPAFLPSFQMPAAPSSTPGFCCFPADQSRAPSSARRFVRFSVDRKTAVRKSSETDIPQIQQCSPRDAARRGFHGGPSIAPRAEVPQYPYADRRLVEFLPPAVLLLIRTQQEYGRLAMDIRAVYMRGCRYRRNRRRIY